MQSFYVFSKSLFLTGAQHVADDTDDHHMPPFRKLVIAEEGKISITSIRPIAAASLYDPDYEIDCTSKDSVELYSDRFC